MLWLKPKLPISDEARQWTDTALSRFAEIFGGECLKSPVVEPTAAFFPTGAGESETAASQIFQQLCEYMAVDAATVQLLFFNEEDPDHEIAQSMPSWERRHSGTAGFYRGGNESSTTIVAVERSQLAAPLSLVATIAHELGHVKLLSEGHIDRDATDMEPLTDLVTVFFGLGIFTANSAAQFKQWDNGSSHGWSFQRQGYLPETTFGYALAAYAQMRGENHPRWTSHLNVNVGTYCRQSLRRLAWEAKGISNSSHKR